MGRSPEELLGKNLWAEFPELVDTEFGQLYQRAVAQDIQLELEGYYAPLDSWFSVRAYPSSVGLSLYFRNINDRKRAEAEIAVLNRDLQNRDSSGDDLQGIRVLIVDDEAGAIPTVAASAIEALTLFPQLNPVLT